MVTDATSHCFFSGLSSETTSLPAGAPRLPCLQHPLHRLALASQAVGFVSSFAGLVPPYLLVFAGPGSRSVVERRRRPNPLGFPYRSSRPKWPTLRLLRLPVNMSTTGSFRWTRPGYFSAVLSPTGLAHWSPPVTEVMILNAITSVHVPHASKAPYCIHLSSREHPAPLATPQLLPPAAVVLRSTQPCTVMMELEPGATSVSSAASVVWVVTGL